jgi:hypothetical protein
MGTHGGKPLQRVKGLLALPVLGSINHLGFIREASHSFLGKGGPDDISGEVLHRFIVARSNPGAAMDIEAGVRPGQDELDHFLCDFFTYRLYLTGLNSDLLLFLA